MDPLSLLRFYSINNKQIAERDDQIIFEEIAWPKNVKTNYMIYGTGNEESSKEYYTLECLQFFLKNLRLPHPAYVKLATAQTVPVVRRPDRKNLLAYLNGEVSTSTAINKLAPLPFQATQVKLPANDALVSNVAKKCRTDEEKVKQQFAARLNTAKEEAVTLDSIKSLSEAMSVEKIAAIKAKRLAKKRTTIKDKDDEMKSVVGKLLGMNFESTKDVISRERIYSNRITILQSKGKDFAPDVFAILNQIKIKESQVNNAVVHTPSSMSNRSMRPLDRPKTYNRYGQERFSRPQAEHAGFRINTMQTYHGQSLKTLTEGFADQNENQIATPISGQLPTSTATITPQQGALSSAKRKRPNRTPIIIIPSANTSLITMHNARDILQDLKFVSDEEKRASGMKRDKEVYLQRCKNGLTVPYEVIDNPQQLEPADWDRVVAVLVMGPLWQFKGWPFNGNPVEIFSKIRAFHMKYDDMTIDSNVAKWDVSVIQLSKTKRHLDKAAIIKFWEILDMHMIKNKAHLRF